MEEADFLARARDREESCEAFFYVGYHYFLRGDARKAQEFFQKTVDTKVFEFLEYAHARAKLKELAGH